MGDFARPFLKLAEARIGDLRWSERLFIEHFAKDRPANDGQGDTRGYWLRGRFVGWLCREIAGSYSIKISGTDDDKHTSSARLRRQFEFLDLIPFRDIRLSGVNIVDDVNLSGIDFDHALILENCKIYGRIDLTDARLGALRLTDSCMDRLIGNGLTCERRAELNEVTVEDNRICDEKLAELLNSAGYDINDRDNPALPASDRDGAETGKDPDTPSKTSIGEGDTVFIDLDGTKFGGLLDLTGSKVGLGKEAKYALTADGMTVAGSVHMVGFIAGGGVSLRGAQIDGEFRMTGASIAADSNPAHLRLDRLRCGASAYLDEKFKVVGGVYLRGASIGGHLWFIGATLINRWKNERASPANPRAIQADRLEVAGSVYFGHLRAHKCKNHNLSPGEAFYSAGRVSLRLAKIQGDLIFRHVRMDFEAPRTDMVDRPDLDAEHYERFLNTDNHGRYDTLYTNQMMVGGDVVFEKDFVSHGRVRMRRTEIGKDLKIYGSWFRNPDGTSFSASGIRVARHIVMEPNKKRDQAPDTDLGGRSNVTFDGTVNMRGAKIGGNFSCERVHFTKGTNRPDDYDLPDAAFIGIRMEVAGSILWGKGITSEGGVYLGWAQVGPLLNLDGIFINNPDDPDNLALQCAHIRAGGSVTLCHQSVRDKDEFKALIQEFEKAAGRDDRMVDPSKNQLEKGDVAFRIFADIRGRVSFRGAEIGGHLDFEETRLRGVDEGCETLSGRKLPNYLAFDGDHLMTGGDVRMRRGFYSRGRVQLHRAQIQGRLNLGAARVHNFWGETLVADGLVVRRSVYLNNGFESRGRSRMRGIQVGGRFDCSGAGFILSSECDSEADRDFTTLNENSIEPAEPFDLLEEPFALNIDGLRSGRDVRFTFEIYTQKDKEGNDKYVVRCFQSQGEISLRTAEIGGRLILSGAELRNDAYLQLGKNDNSDAPRAGTSALAATRAHIRRGVYFSTLKSFQHREKPGVTPIRPDEMRRIREFVATGCIDFMGARIDGNVELNDISFMENVPDSTGTPLCFQNARINGHLNWNRKESTETGFIQATNGFPTSELATLRSYLWVAQKQNKWNRRFRGLLDVSHANVNVINISAECWPEYFDLRGLIFKGRGGDAPSKAYDWAPILEYQKTRYLSLEPYEHLIAIYRREGLDETVRRLSIGKQRVRHKENRRVLCQDFAESQPRHLALNRWRSTLSRYIRFWLLANVYSLLAAFGHSSLRVFCWGILIMWIGGCIFSDWYGESRFYPSKVWEHVPIDKYHYFEEELQAEAIKWSPSKTEASKTLGGRRIPDNSGWYSATVAWVSGVYHCLRYPHYSTSAFPYCSPVLPDRDRMMELAVDRCAEKECVGLPSNYPPFSSWAYAVDSFVPFLDLDQEDHWVLKNDFKVVHRIRQSEINTDDKPIDWHYMIRAGFVVLGWVLSTLFAVTISGLVKRDH